MTAAAFYENYGRYIREKQQNPSYRTGPYWPYLDVIDHFKIPVRKDFQQYFLCQGLRYGWLTGVFSYRHLRWLRRLQGNPEEFPQQTPGRDFPNIHVQTEQHLGIIPEELSIGN